MIDVPAVSLEAFFPRKVVASAHSYQPGEAGKTEAPRNSGPTVRPATSTLQPVRSEVTGR